MNLGVISFPSFLTSAQPSLAAPALSCASAHVTPDFLLAAATAALIKPRAMAACVRSQLCISGSWTHVISAEDKMERHSGDEMIVVWLKLKNWCTNAPSWKY